jgi:hypothetical protein
MPGERYSQIPMTPDRTVQWDVYDNPGARGFLILSPDCPDHATNALSEAVGTMDVDPGLMSNEIGSGAEGHVYKWPGLPLAIKVTSETASAGVSFPGLQANVTLREGLHRTSPSTPRVTYTTPQYYGAHFPYRQNTTGRAAWAMSYEAGVERGQLPPAVRRIVPPASTRRAVYQRALEACGGNPRDYSDLVVDENELMRPGTNSMGRIAVTIVKLDVGPAVSEDRTGLYNQHTVPSMRRY